MQTTDVREIMREWAVSRETAQEISDNRAVANAALYAQAVRDRPALRAKADAAYAVAEYRARKPGGKNAAKAGIRAARLIMRDYVRHAG